tara:strand:+ start:2391 stop:3335 length:945 start_codon:yes stop_codon:yes gene_type:complete
MNIEEANAMFEWPTKHQVQNGLLTEKQINKQYGKVDVYVKSFMNGMGGDYFWFRTGLAYNVTHNVGVARGLKYAKSQKFFSDNNIGFYYMDTGYFGNNKSKVNPSGGKAYHRIAYNQFQCGAIKDFTLPYSRFVKTGEELKGWRTLGKRILLCPPSLKSLRAFRLGDEALAKEYLAKYGKVDHKWLQVYYDEWIEKTVSEIKKHTDRKIIIRTKPESRAVRLNNDTFKDAVLNKVFATVTYNSIVSVESIVNGVPAFVMQENAAAPVASTDITKIESPIRPDRQEWLAWLAHNQFTEKEMRNGFAFETLKKLHG